MRIVDCQRNEFTYKQLILLNAITENPFCTQMQEKRSKIKQIS